jgi:hypothetical protein
MSSNAASTNGATQTLDAKFQVLPAMIEVLVKGLRIIAPSLVSPAREAKTLDNGVFAKGKEASIWYKAKYRQMINPANAKSADEILASLDGSVTNSEGALKLGSNYRAEDGSVKVGKEADKLNKDGSVRLPGRPLVVFTGQEFLGPDGFEYQVNVRCAVGEVKAGRYLEVSVAATQVNRGSFQELGEVEGEIDLG